VRYVAEGEPVLMAQCHCRTCQTFTGGAPNTFMAMPAEGFRYTKGEVKSYRAARQGECRHARVLRARAARRSWRGGRAFRPSC
jgi:hypothetical protein